MYMRKLIKVHEFCSFLLFKSVHKNMLFGKLLQFSRGCRVGLRLTAEISFWASQYIESIQTTFWHLQRAGIGHVIGLWTGDVI